MIQSLKKDRLISYKPPVWGDVPIDMVLYMQNAIDFILKQEIQAFILPTKNIECSPIKFESCQALEEGRRDHDN